MKKSILTLALVLLAAEAFAQPAPTKTANLSYLYDVDSATLTYCVMSGQTDDPFGTARVGTSAIKTVGTSATLTEFTASSGPFAPLSVGDTIFVTDAAVPPSKQTVIVTAKASAASITVNTAITLNGTLGHQFTWLKQVCGTSASSGWAAVSGFSNVAMTMQYEQGDLDGLRVRWECRMAGVGAQPVIVYPGETADCGIGGTLSSDRCNFALAGFSARLTAQVVGNLFAQCRVGLAFAATDTSDAGANVEQVTVILTKN